MVNNTATNRDDPIRKNHFRPLEVAESISGGLFYFGAAWSFLPFIIDRNSYPNAYAFVITIFVILVVVKFGIGVSCRLYFHPRAEDARRKEFISNAFGFDLIHERTSGYYNNSESEPLRRMGVSTLENLFFTKAILRAMAPKARATAGIYLVAWIAVAVSRDIEVDWVLAGAQVLFAEEILSYWLRLEWARNRAEVIYESTHRVFQLQSSGDRQSAYILAAFSDYESGKSIGGILLSQKVFEKLNPQLSIEWEAVKSGLPVCK